MINPNKEIKPFIAIGDCDDWHVCVFKLQGQFLLEVGGENINDCLGSYLINEAEAEAFLRKTLAREDVREVSSETQELQYNYSCDETSDNVQSILDQKWNDLVTTQALVALKREVFEELWKLR